MHKIIQITICMFCIVLSSEIFAKEIQNTNSSPIKDHQGKILYIIDLVDNATLGHSKERIAPGGLDDEDGLQNWHKPEMRRLARDISKQLGFIPVNITSWVGNSIIAYLTPGQVKKLQKDSRVALITQDSFMEMSGGWVDTPIMYSIKNETTSWGVHAVNGGTQINHSGNGITVYVLDAGVGHHQDLGGYFNAQGQISDSQVQRFNPNEYRRNGDYIVAGTPASAVGCYSHATHVAGIIGAQGNLIGTRGVNPGVPIVSVGVTTEPSAVSYFTLSNGTYTSHCSTGAVTLGTTGSIAVGLDLIMNKIATSTSGKPGIVNMSINPPVDEPVTDTSNPYRFGATLGYKLWNLSQPGLRYIGGQLVSYPGAFLALSAGNGYTDACKFAFDGYQNGGALAFDGIMVVGGINSAGFPVSPANGGFINNPLYAVSEAGSNYGKCVDVWAPGNIIMSTWGAMPYSAFPGNITAPPQLDNIIYANKANLSGTSMAAPHIAGLAAYLAETLNLITPQQIEAAVRARFIWQNTYDNAGYPVNMPVLP